MQLRHPFKALSISGQNRAFILFFILSVMVMVGLQVTGAPLINDVSPGGILSFEFAGELAHAQRMIDSWGPTGRIYAGLNLGLDYLFLAVYACAIALGCVLVSRGLYRRNAALTFDDPNVTVFIYEHNFQVYSEYAIGLRFPIQKRIFWWRRWCW